MTTARTFGEKKATRAFKHAKLLQEKVDAIKARTRLGVLEAEIESIRNAGVNVVCPVCKHPHVVPIKDYTDSQFRRVCRECFERAEYIKHSDVLHRVNDTIKEPCIQRISFDTHQYARTITLTLPRTEYDVKKRRY